MACVHANDGVRNPKSLSWASMGCLLISAAAVAPAQLPAHTPASSPCPLRCTRCAQCPKSLAYAAAYPAADIWHCSIAGPHGRIMHGCMLTVTCGGADRGSGARIGGVRGGDARDGLHQRPHRAHIRRLPRAQPLPTPAQIPRRLPASVQPPLILNDSGPLSSDSASSSESAPAA